VQGKFHDFVGRWLPTAESYPEGRLFSLDLLRGLDMLLLTVIGPLVCSAQTSWNGFSPSVMRQFGHGWEGFTLWDIIMPLFIFMCGAAMPFALSRRLKEGRGVFWKHVFFRVVLLWVLGCFCQGRLADLDPMTFSPYSNTLQAIAAGYLITAAMMAVGSRLFSIILPIVLALVYTFLLAFGGDYTEYGNFAFKVDHVILSAILPAGNPFTKLASPNMYTWFLTSLMFAVMTMCGYHAAVLLRAAHTQGQKAVRLVGGGLVLLVVGWGVSPWIPVIKPIFTLSFTLQAMGWCVLALAVLYVVTDICRFRKGTALALLYGQCALAVYVSYGFLGGMIMDVVKSFGSGLIRHSGTGGPFVRSCLFCIGLTMAMAIWRKVRSRSSI